MASLRNLPTALVSAVGAAAVAVLGFFARDLFYINQDKTLADQVSLEVMKSADPIEKIALKLNCSLTWACWKTPTK